MISPTRRVSEALSRHPGSFCLFLLLACLACASATINTVRATDGIPIALVQRGAGETTLVFVHGWMGDRSNWDHQLSEFSEKYRVVALDLAGFGLSGTGREAWTMEAYGRDVAQVVKGFATQNVVLVGHSMGSAVVLEAALLMPERVLGVVGVDVFQDVEKRYTEDQVAAEIVKRERYMESELRRRELAERPAAWTESLREYFRWRSGRLLEALALLHAPLFCINSDRFETDVEMARRHSPSFSVHIVENVGHGVMAEDPDRFNNFLHEILRELEAPS